jgi:hypothetical protein
MTYIEKLRAKTDEQLLSEIKYQKEAIEIARRDLRLMQEVLIERSVAGERSKA